MRLLLTIMALLALSRSSAQIYLEDFNVPDSVGIIGPCDSVPLTCETYIPSQTGWILDGNTIHMENHLDWMTVDNGRLEARDLGGEVCFLSPVVDISISDLVEMKVSISEVGNHEASDYVDVFAVIDDSSYLIPAVVGEDSLHTLIGNYPTSDDWGDTTVTLEGIQGDTLQIRICVRNNSADEKIRIDDIEVIASLPAIAPIVFISELDCDQIGTDTTDFIELAGEAGQSLDGFDLVLFNGTDDASYAAYDLDGYALNAQGFFTICFADIYSEYCDLNVSASLQNGPDGVGLYYGRSDGAFPNDTPLDTLGLVDGLRYGTSDPNDVGLAALDMDVDCPEVCQIDEDIDGNSGVVSIQRGSWYVGPPTPGQPNYSPLPVRLIRFNAEARENANLLTWETAEEFHNDRFEVQRKTGRNDFQTIGSVAGEHQSSVRKRYSFLDRNVPRGNLFYRLRIVSEDETVEFSEILSIRIEHDVMNIEPTLTDGPVRVSNPAGDVARIMVYSMSGQLVFSNSLEFYVQDVELGHLDPGIYAVRLEAPRGSFTKKIVLF